MSQMLHLFHIRHHLQLHQPIPAPIEYSLLALPPSQMILIPNSIYSNQLQPTAREDPTMMICRPLMNKLKQKLLNKLERAIKTQIQTIYKSID